MTSTRTAAITALPLLLALLGGCPSNLSSSSTGGGGDGTTSSSSTSGGTCAPEGLACIADADCPPSMVECVSPICAAGCCSAVSVPAGAATMTQTPGDCRLFVCDGDGGTDSIADDGDVPPDADECHAGGCLAGVPQQTLKPACVPPTCNDGLKNGTEIDVDCGGGTCPKCAAGQTCLVASDCQTDFCAGGVCAIPDCNDGLKNGPETDVDCGGPTCAKCALGKGCQVASDCVTPACVGGKCTACGSAADCAIDEQCDTSHTCVPLCAGLPATCGPSGNESCCASLPVPGGGFFRSYDGVSVGYTQALYAAGVSDFRLDRFEVTVGRFRPFLAAVLSGYRPPAASGKHAHLAAGAGLNGGTEQGWDPIWNAYLDGTAAQWDSSLDCDVSAPWTPTPASNESLPITCISWLTAYAYCIWSGGFLPTEAEWNYAAAGGNEQRVYPWSIPATSTAIDDTFAIYASNPLAAAGSRSPKGDGKWGHADLAGSVWEWNLDEWDFGSYAQPCIDCVDTMGVGRIARGGGWDSAAAEILASHRRNFSTAERYPSVGVRCARSP